MGHTSTQSKIIDSKMQSSEEATWCLLWPKKITFSKWIVKNFRSKIQQQNNDEKKCITGTKTKQTHAKLMRQKPEAGMHSERVWERKKRQRSNKENYGDFVLIFRNSGLTWMPSSVCADVTSTCDITFATAVHFVASFLSWLFFMPLGVFFFIIIIVVVVMCTAFWSVCLLFLNSSLASCCSSLHISLSLSLSSFFRQIFRLDYTIWRVWLP